MRRMQQQAVRMQEACTFLKAVQGATSSMYRLPLPAMASAASSASCSRNSSYAAAAASTCKDQLFCLTPHPACTSAATSCCPAPLFTRTQESLPGCLEADELS